MFDSACKKLKDDLFRNTQKNIKVFLRTSYTQGSNFDPFRDVQYTKSISNPLNIKAVVRTLSSNSLIIRDFGLKQTGAIEILIRDSDVNFIRKADKIEYKGIEYYAYNDAIGNRLQITDKEFGYSRVIVFRKEN